MWDVSLVVVGLLGVCDSGLFMVWSKGENRESSMKEGMYNSVGLLEDLVGVKYD